MQADEEHGAVGDLAGQLGHARPGGEQVDRSRHGRAVAQPRLGRLESHRFPGEEATDCDDASRMMARVARGRPMLRAARKPGAMVRQIRPGAISSRLCAAEASSRGWRTMGLDVAG